MNPQDDLLWQRMRDRQNAAYDKYNAAWDSRTGDNAREVQTAWLDYIAETTAAWEDFRAAKLAVSEVAHA